LVILAGFFAAFWKMLVGLVVAVVAVLRSISKKNKE
jgi:uncharacterized membrane-anchored protein